MIQHAQDSRSTGIREDEGRTFSRTTVWASYVSFFFFFVLRFPQYAKHISVGRLIRHA